MNFKDLGKKLLQFVPALFALAYVAMSATTYVYLDGLDEPVDEDNKEKYNNAKISSIVNLGLSGILLLIVILVYLKSMKPQKQYITYF